MGWQEAAAVRRSGAWVLQERRARGETFLLQIPLDACAKRLHERRACSNPLRAMLARKLQPRGYMKEYASTIRRVRLATGLVVATAGLLIPALAGAAVQPLASIRSAAEHFVRARMPPGHNGIVVTAGRLDPRLRLKRCAAPLRAALLAGARLQANASVAVGCTDGAEWTIYVPVTIESRVKVWALRKAEGQGARLSAADVVPETRLVTGLAAGYVTDLAQLGRSTLRHPLPAGAVLRSEDLLADFLVRQGQQVILVASLDGIKVRAPGLALQAGRYGALIRVQNLTSSKIVQGIVHDGNVVDVTP